MRKLRRNAQTASVIMLVSLIFGAAARAQEPTVRADADAPENVLRLTPAELPAGSVFEMPAKIHHFGWTSARRSSRNTASVRSPSITSAPHTLNASSRPAVRGRSTCR